VRSFGIDVEGAGTGIEVPVPVAVAGIDPVGGDLSVFGAADGFRFVASSRVSERFARRVDDKFDGIEATQAPNGLPVLTGNALATVGCITTGYYAILVGAISNGHVANGGRRPLTNSKYEYFTLPVRTLPRRGLAEPNPNSECASQAQVHRGS
jgi:hypothetical protein